MRRVLAAGCALLAATAVGATPGDAQDPQGSIRSPLADVERAGPRGAHVAREAIVRYRPGASAAARERSRASVGATSARALRLPRSELLRLPAGRTVAAAVRDLERRSEVEVAQPNFVYRLEAVPDDPRFDEQYALQNTGQTGGVPDADVDAPEAWDVGAGDGVVIGILDSGVNVNHPDLAPNVNSGGFDFVNDDTEVADDFLQHGTFVASVAAARGGNGQGMSGVAQRARILPLQAAAGDGISTDAAVDAIAHAKAAGARVVNMSFGSFGLPDGGDKALRAAIESAPDILFVASAGNLHPIANAPNDNDVEPHWPSNLSADHANVVAVASTTYSDELSASSSFGGDSVSVAAPGESVLGADALSPLLSESFDGVVVPAIPAAWGGGWATTTEQRASVPNSLADSPGADYAADSDVATTSPDVAVPSPSSACSLSYARRVRTRPGDVVRTEVAANGSLAFEVLDSASGSIDAPAELDVLISGVTSLRVRLRLQSNGALEDDGVHVDDLDLSCNHPNAAAFSLGSGTSFAAPVVAGAAAVLLGRNSTLTPAQLKLALMSTVDQLPSLSGKVVSGGRLNLDRAVRAVAGAGASLDGGPAAGARPGPGSTVASTVDRRRPVVSSAVLVPSAFQPLRSGAMLSATRRGASLRFRVDEPSRVRVRLLRPSPGRRAGRRCVAPTRRNRRARRCTRQVAVGSATLRGLLVGAVSRRFSGRARGRPLRPGGYRLEIAAVDAAGNRSLPRRVTFRIVGG